MSVKLISAAIGSLLLILSLYVAFTWNITDDAADTVVLPTSSEPSARPELEPARQQQALGAIDKDLTEPSRSAPSRVETGKAELDSIAAQAVSAFEASDCDGYTQAFMKLVDLGSPAFATLFDVVNATTGNAAQRRFRLGPCRNFHTRLRERKTKLNPLLDAILARNVDPDNSTLFALHLMEFYEIHGNRRKGEHAKDLLNVLQRCIALSEETPPDSQLERIFGWMANHVGYLRVAQSLPELEELFWQAHSDRQAKEIFHAVALTGGEGAVEILQRALEHAPEYLRYEMLEAATQGRPGIEDSQVKGFVDEQIAERGYSERGSELRLELLRKDARDPRRLTELAEKLDDPGFSPQERRISSGYAELRIEGAASGRSRYVFADRRELAKTGEMEHGQLEGGKARC